MTNYPEIFFTVGALKSAGVYVHNYALIGIELAIGNTETDVSEFSGKRLSDRFENQNADNFLYVAIHELVHTQQKQEGLTLLGQSLCEGACDFIAELVMDTTLQLTHLKYGRIHEEEIKAKFKNEMFRTSFDGWLYSGNSSQAVSDLGYFMGYVICKSYYNKNKNKHRAIRDIIQLRYSDKHEIKKFLRQSGYRF